MNTKQATDLIGKRWLFKVNGAQTEHEIREGSIKVLSPSGNYVCMGGGEWVEADKLTLLEELPDKPAKAKAPAAPVDLVKTPETPAEPTATTSA